MRWLLAVLGVLCALLVAAAAGIGWLVGTEAGLHWAASHARGARFEGLRGRLASEVTAERVWYENESVRVEAAQLQLRAHLAALLGGRLTIDPLRAEALHLELRETPAGKSAAPELPLRLDLANLEVGELSVRRGAARYVVKELRIQHARIGQDVSLAGSFYWPDERFATRARLELRGPLARLEAHAVGEVAGVAAEARGVLAPQSAQPLQSLEAHAGPVDLARFDLPWRTGLSLTLRAGPAPGDALAGALSLENALSGPLDGERLPFTRLDARFLTDFASARLEGLRIALAGGASVQGDASLHAGHVEAKLVATAVDLRSLHSRLRRTALHGPLQLVVAGERQWARGRLAQAGIGITAQVLRTGDELEVQELHALAEGGEVNATGTATLTGAMPFSAQLEVRGFDPAALGDYPRGSLSGSGVAKGRLQPRDVALEWNLDDSTVYGHTFRSSGSARLAGQRLTQADAELRLGANRLTARGAYGRASDELALTLEAPRLEQFAPVGGDLRARATLRGSLDNPRAELSAEAKKLVLPGGVQLQELAASARGTLAAHDVQLTAREPALALELAARLRGGWSDARGWAGEILALQNSGAYPLESVAPAPLRVAPGRVELGRLEARLDAGRLVINQAAWSPARVSSSGEFSRLPAQWLIVAAGLDDKVSATLLLDGEWQVTRAAQLDGLVRVRRASGDLALTGAQSIALGLERAALEVRFDAGRASGEAQAASRLAQLAVQGELMPSLSLQGKLEFEELGTLTRPFLELARVGGRLSAELRASGTLAKPVLHGTLTGEALAFAMPQYGVALKDGTLKAVLEGESLKLESLAMRGGEGRLSASGTLPLGREGTARIDWRAEKLTLLDRPDLRLVASGAGEASYDGKRVALTGDLRADRGQLEFARDRLPELGEDVVVLGREAPKKPATRLPVALDLRLDLGDNLVVRGYGFDGRVGGLVELSTSSEGELRAFGRLTAVNATFLAYGQRLEVDPGVVIFDGPLDNPTLQITAWRRNQAVEAGVQVTGTVRAPSVNLVSQPPVPEGERLSWLVLGRAPSGATQADLGLLQAAAGALLSGGDSVPLDRRIARRFGLDEVSLRGSGELTDRVVAVGKRLSDRLYVSYEQGIGAVVSNLVKLDYALGRRWTLRAETGTTSGGGVFYRYSWD